MRIDLVIVQIAIIFLPGLIWAGLDSRYGRKSVQSDSRYAVRACMFGITSYAVTFLLYSLIRRPFNLTYLSNAAANGVFTASIAEEVASATVVGLILAILSLYATNYKWVTFVLQRIGATKTFGDEDVWEFTFNSSVAAVEYVHFRDFANQIVYAGWVREFSETEKLRELVLRDVEVYNFDGAKLFETPLIYLSRQPDKMHIEFPYHTG